MKKKACIFTIVKDEDYFLPIWMKYYSQYFNKEDIYILDHNTVGDSTKNLDCNVIKLDYDELFNHQWLCSTVENYQRILLEKYEIVVFVEVDEILFSTEKSFDMIIEDLYNSNSLYITCTGYEILQDLKTEKPLLSGDSIAKNRKYWMPHQSYSKTLVSKIPLNWQLGFHNILNKDVNILDNFYMAHLHLVDADQTYRRYIDRIKEGGKLNTNIMKLEEWQKFADSKFFYETWPFRDEYRNREWQFIPEKHLSKLNEYGL